MTMNQAPQMPAGGFPPLSVASGIADALYNAARRCKRYFYRPVASRFGAETGYLRSNPFKTAL
jgi:hypothetical protein